MRTMVVCTGLLLALCSPAAAQVVADSFDRADGTLLGSSEVGGITYREWSNPGGGPYADDVAAIAGNRLRIHGSSISTTDPGIVLVAGGAFDVELRVVVRFLDDDYLAPQRANCLNLVLRNSGPDGAAPGIPRGLVGLNLVGSGPYSVVAIGSSPQTILSGFLPAAALAAVDIDGDGVLESGEPFTAVLRAVGDRFTVSIGGVPAIDVTIPTDAITGVDPQVARGVWIGRSRFFGVPEEIEIDLDDFAVFEDLCPEDPDKLDPGACGCGVPETPGCGDAGPIDAAPPEIDAPDVDVDAAPGPDAGPAIDDPDGGGGCCGAASDSGLATLLLTLAVMFSMSATSHASRRNRRKRLHGHHVW